MKILRKIENKLFKNSLPEKEINYSKLLLFLSIQKISVQNRINKFINKEFSELKKIIRDNRRRLK